MIATLLNVAFFGVFIAPKIVKYLFNGYKAFLLLDLFYNKIWDKILFCTGVSTVLFRQWLGANVCRLDANSYKVSLILNGELCNFIVSRIASKVVEIEDNETNESYIQEGESFVNWNVQPWKPVRRSTCYFENGEISTIKGEQQ